MRTAFNQNDIKNWDRFASVANALGFSIRVTGGLFNTHEIDASPADFAAVVELASA
jgi:hypothetical protein